MRLAYFKIACVLASILFLSACSSLIFYPGNRFWKETPAQTGLNYQNLQIQVSKDSALNAWLIQPTQQSLGIVLYFHGNTNNISYHIGQIRWLVDAGYQVLMVDYPGFGHSFAKLSLKDSVKDMQTLMHLFIRQYAGQNKWLLGQSLGAALSIYSAGSDKTLAHAFNGYIFDSGFASFQKIAKDVAARHWLTWLIQYPASWFMPIGYDADTQIGHFSPKPVLILHSHDDKVVPYYHAQLLYQAAKAPKSLISYQGKHIKAFEQIEIKAQVLEFLVKSRKPPEPLP